MQNWMAALNGDPNTHIPAHEWLLAPERSDKLTDEGVGWLLWNLSHDYRGSGDPAQRAKACPLYMRLQKRIATDWGHAGNFIACISECPASPEESRAAIEQFLSFDPPQSNGDATRRVLEICADRVKDPELTKRAVAFWDKMSEKFGFDFGQGASAGTYMDRGGMHAEAMAAWEKVITAEPYWIPSQYQAAGLELVRRAEGQATR